MKIAVLSDCRVPTLATGGHGLGRMAWDIATGLHKRGHGVTLYAGIGSDQPACTLVTHADETARSTMHVFDEDAIIDLSHLHDLSNDNPALPVINWVVDTEVRYQPPNTVVGNAWQQKAFPTARIVPLGIDVDAIPLVDEAQIALDRINRSRAYLAYAAKIHAAKGYDIALDVHCRQMIPVRFVGERFVDDPLPDWRAEVTGDDFYAFIGHAAALLSPCRVDAGGRVNLEAAACGTPVLCLDGTGTAEHVEHCVSGYVCRDVAEMVDAVADLRLLDRAKARAWVRETHDIRVMVGELERLARAVADGERW